jgi:hypothetical protein
MSVTTELTNQIIDFIYRQDGYAWRSSSTGIFDRKIGGYRTAAKRGVSDILACFKGQLIAIEIKIGKDRLSPEQEGFILSVNHTGGKAFVVHDLEEFMFYWNNWVCG